MPINRLYFKCPECESNTLEEVSDALTYHTIDCFYDGHEQYGDSETEYVGTRRYQCYACSHVIYEGGCNDIVQHCIDKGWIEGMETAPDWEI